MIIRLIDTGGGISKEINEGIVKWEKIFFTSKLFILQPQVSNTTLTIKQSLDIMNLDYLDLYLIHQPYGDVYGAGRAMVAVQQSGTIKSIGFSNFKSAKRIEFVGLNEVKHRLTKLK